MACRQEQAKPQGEQTPAPTQAAQTQQAAKTPPPAQAKPAQNASENTTPIDGDYELVELRINNSRAPLNVRGRFTFREGKFSYNFLLDGKEVAKFTGRVGGFNLGRDNTFRLVYDDFMLFVERHDYSINANNMSISPGTWISQEVDNAMEKRGAPVAFGERRLILRKVSS